MKTLLFFLAFTLYSCTNSTIPEVNTCHCEFSNLGDVILDYTCKDGITADLAEIVYDFENEQISDQKVFTNEIEAFSTEYHDYITSDVNVISPRKYKWIYSTFNEIIDSVLAYDYELYLPKNLFVVRSNSGPIINASTTGTNIYIYEGLINWLEEIEFDNEYSKSDLLTSVICHEIGHLINGDISNQIRREKIIGADQPGNAKAILFNIWNKTIKRTGINQHAETRADLTSMHLVYICGINPMAVVEFWKEMEHRNPREGDFTKYFSTHGTPRERAQCLWDYHHTNCKNISSSKLSKNG